MVTVGVVRVSYFQKTHQRNARKQKRKKKGRQTPTKMRRAAALAANFKTEQDKLKSTLTLWQ